MKKIFSFLLASLFSVMLLSAAPTNGLLFSGNTSSIINLGPQPAFSPTQFTMEVWVNYQVLNGGGYIISTEGATPSNHGYSLRLSGNKLQFAFGDGSGWPGITSSADIVTKTWFHVAITYSGTQVKMFINGVQDATAAVTTPMVASPEKVIFGDSPSWTNRCFNGIISDFRFWNVVREQTDIAADMTSSLAGTEAGLVAGWKMNEGSGTTVADVKATFPITIASNVAWYPATAMTVTGNAISTIEGTSQLSATINGNLAAANGVTWSVNNPNIATVSSTGLLTANNNGTVTVTATSKDGSGVSVNKEIVVSNQPTPLKQALIDFGPATQANWSKLTVSPDLTTNYYWNNYNGADVNSTATLIDKTNAATGITLTTVTVLSANPTPGAPGLDVTNATALGDLSVSNATLDYFFTQSTGSLKFSGLSANKAYKFYLYGCRLATDTRITQYTFTGASTTVGTLQTSGTDLGGAGINGNKSNLFITPLIYANASGEISLLIGNTAGGFGYLNDMKLEEYNSLVVKVSGITVSGNAISTVGGTSQLTAAVLPADATLKDVVWTVDNPTIASISSTGLLTAIKNGTVTVTATSKDGSGITGSVQIVVSNQLIPVKVVYLDFGPDGGTSGFATTNPDSNRNNWNTLTNATAAAESVSLIDKAGNPSGYSIKTLVDFTVNPNNGVMGLATPTAQLLGDIAIPSATKDFFFLDGNTATRSLKITGLSANKGYKFYAYGCRVATDNRISKYTFTGKTSVTGTQQTSGTNLGGTGINGNNSNIFSTPIMAADANGEVKFELGFVTGMAYINVMKIEEYTVDVQSVAVTGDAITTNGGTSQMIATFLPENATLKEVNWTVNNPRIATISSTGLLTAIKNGIVTVTATSKDGSAISGSVQITLSNQPTPEKEVYIDFGPNGGTSGFATTNPDSNGNNWNTLNNATAAAGSVALLDKAGNPSGFSMITLVDFTVNPNNGVMGLASPTTELLGDFAIPSATKDFFFLDGNTATRSLKITGLSAHKGYKFYAYGCRVATDNRVSKYTFIGDTTVTGTQQTSGTNLGGTGINGNNSTIFSTPIMAADANGEVKFELGFVTGMAYINIMKIEEYTINVVSIAVTGDDITINGGTSQMTASIAPAYGTENGITWSVDDQTIATIDANGLLTAKTNGTVVVTATTKEVDSTVSGSHNVQISGQIITGLTNKSATVKVFPVVFDQKVTIFGATNLVELFNSNGIKVMSQNTTSETDLNTSNLSKGVYILVVDKKQSYKLVKL